MLPSEVLCAVIGFSDNILSGLVPSQHISKFTETNLKKSFFKEIPKSLESFQAVSVNNTKEKKRMLSSSLFVVELCGYSYT